MNKKKVVILGHFGGNQIFNDGQTIKTRILYDELLANTNWDIRIVDTFKKHRNPIELLLISFYHFFMAKDIIVLLSGNGMKFYFPLLALLSKLFNKRIYHDVIGGNLDKYVLENHFFKSYLNSFVVNWVETENLKDRLNKLGVTNCVVLPNFKRLNINTDKLDSTQVGPPYRFCTFSRVMREKGIEDAVRAIESVNKEFEEGYFTLDIFGKIDDTYQDEFESLMNNCSSSICYRGIVDYALSVDTLKNYYALLFPTFWEGEGFPGTIIDAYSAGLPVIATDWNSNSEIVIHKITGLIYPSDEFFTLKDAILWLTDHKDIYLGMRDNCINEAIKYQPDNILKSIMKEIDQY